jgi:hypothetical protein
MQLNRTKIKKHFNLISVFIMNKKLLLVLFSACLLSPIQSKAFNVVGTGATISLNLASLLCYYKAFHSPDDKPFWAGAGLTLNFIAAHVANESDAITPLTLLAPQIAIAIATNRKIIYNTAEFALYCGGAAYLAKKTIEFVNDK